MKGESSKARLLPSEPRVPESGLALELTARHLLPALAELEVFFLAVRAQVDPVLCEAIPVKNGKPYPLGQCLEISLAVAQHLKDLNPTTLPGPALEGYRAWAAFMAAGGTMRRIWGDLRGKYFQNAFLLGTLYVDVSNDTLVVTKPKVEILPFEAAGIKPIADYHHFASIARQYWEVSLYPNHVLPDLAPSFPVWVVYPSGRMEARDANDYLMSLNWAEAFRPAESYLAGAPMPQEVFDLAVAQLKGSLHRLPRSPADGRRLALQHVRNHRKKRWHHQLPMQRRMLEAGLTVNLDLAQSKPMANPEVLITPPSKPMNILFIHQNFPGQFKFLAPALVQHGHAVVAMTMQKSESKEWQGVKLVPYSATRGTTPNVHPWVSDFETKTIRGEACFRAALQMKTQGFTPDVIIAHHGWGESLFLKEVWPEAKLGIYCEFFYHPHGADVGFDPEFPVKDAGDACRLRLKNLNNLLHFEVADAGIIKDYKVDLVPKR